LEEYLEKCPNKLEIAAHRTVICQLFKDLPDEEQAKWKRRAEEERKLKTSAATVPLTGEARNK
jgi:hypothetical protein